MKNVSEKRFKKVVDKMSDGVIIYKSCSGGAVKTSRRKNSGRSSGL